VIDDSNKQAYKVVFYFEPEDDEHKYQLEGMSGSLYEVGKMVRRNGGKWLESYDDIIKYIYEYDIYNGNVATEEEKLAYTE
jgi:hypothetical protein